MTLKRAARGVVGRIQKWLESEDSSSNQAESIPFDNSYRWLGQAFKKLMADPVCAQRPQYSWGILQGAALAAVLGVKKISAVELGLGAGAGLVAMERVAELCEQMIGIQIQVFGFDTGTGYPKPKDYRDMPYKSFEGDYPCDKEELRKRLRRAKVTYGLVGETVAGFLQSNPPPLGFVGYDVFQYSSTREALRLFEADHDRLLPRTPCSFRSTVGKDYCDFIGETLAVSEFNAAHEMRKLSRIPGMSYFVPAEFNSFWTQTIHSLHVFDHPLYNVPESLQRSAIIDVNGREIFVASQPGADLKTARPTWVQERSQ